MRSCALSDQGPQMPVAFAIFKLLSGFSNRPMARRTYRNTKGEEIVLDQTGRVVEIGREPPPVEILRDPTGAVLAYFPSSLAHSLWRGQELSLFARACAEFRPPLLDFGCGDGSLSNCILEKIEFGIDVDQDALAVADRFKLYEQLLTFDEMKTKIATASIGTVFSVSVLEHTDNLAECLSEIARVLKPGGRFYFSVPNLNL